MFESLPERQQRLLRLVADGLSDPEIAERVGEPEQVISHEIEGILTELGFRTRTHAIVYVLAREISATTRDHTPPAPVTHDLSEEEPDTAETERSEEKPA